MKKYYFQKDVPIEFKYSSIGILFDEHYNKGYCNILVFRGVRFIDLEDFIEAGKNWDPPMFIVEG